MNDITLRNAIRDQITGITPLDTREQSDITDATNWIDSGADLFRIKKPDVPPKHLVSYLVLVDEAQKSILLVDHIKAQLWLPTGGHILPGERPEDAVVREANEELNIKASFFRGNKRPFFITVVETVGLTPGHNDVSLWYLLRANKHDFIRFDKSEFTDIEWFTFDEIFEFDEVVLGLELKRFTRKLATYLE